MSAADRVQTTSGGETAIEDLTTVPSLAAIYARQLPAALAGLVKDGLVRRRGEVSGGSAGTVPDVGYRARGLRVDPARLTAFAHLTRAPGSDLLPPGFVHATVFPVAMALLAREDFPLPLAGLVHLQNRWQQRCPFTLASVLTVTTRAEGLRPHRSGTLVDVVSEIRDEAGGGTDAEQPVAVDRSTYLARGHRLAGAAPGPRPETDRGTTGEFTPPVPTGQWRLGTDAGRRFAAVSGDWNPIHLSAPTARLLGLRGAIAHGMFTASRGLATIRLPEAYTWDVAFAAPVVLPATVAVRVDGHPEDSDGARLTGWDPRSGRLHLTATVTAA